MAKRQVQIAIRTDKNGKQTAWRYSFEAMWWFRISFESAMVMLSTGEAKEIYRKG